MDLSDVRVVHVIPGRARLKLGPLKGDSALARTLESSLRTIPGITEVVASAATGSLLIQYDLEGVDLTKSVPQAYNVIREIFPALSVSAKQLNQLVSRMRKLDGQSAGGLGQRIVRGYKGLNGRINRLSKGTVDLRILVPISLLAFGLAQLAAPGTTPLPPWWNLLWYSFGTFRVLNPLRP